MTLLPNVSASTSRIPQAKTASPRSNSEFFRGIYEDKLSPASPSMHETSLYQKDKWIMPTMASVRLCNQALERDAFEQMRKYGCTQPTAQCARFAVALPQGPQHTKFSTEWARSRGSSPRQGHNGAASSLGDSASDAGDASDSKPKFEQGFKFNVATLERWFKEIDTDGTGEVSRKELLVALRKQRELQRMMLKVQGADFKNETFLDGTKLSPGEEMRVAQREENQRIKRIMEEVDTDGSGSMEWPEFVDFFRRAGMLLEYRTKSALNRTEFWPQQSAAAKDATRSPTTRTKLETNCDAQEESREGAEDQEHRD